MCCVLVLSIHTQSSHKHILVCNQQYEIIKLLILQQVRNT